MSKALYQAISRKNLSEVQELLDSGENIESTWRRRTPLIHAIMFGTPEITHYLLECGANVNAPSNDKDGKTALHWCAMQGTIHEMRLLLEYGAEVDVRDEFAGFTPLMLAVRGIKDVQEKVTLLLDAGADINAKNTRWGLSTLWCATQEAATDLVRYLVERGADIHTRNQNGNTLLMSLAQFSNLTHFFDFVEVAHLLIDLGVDIDATNPEGRTALMLAAEHGNTQIAHALITLGANKEVKDNQGYTVYDYATHIVSPDTDLGLFLKLDSEGKLGEAHQGIIESYKATRQNIADLLRR